MESLTDQIAALLRLPEGWETCTVYLVPGQLPRIETSQVVTPRYSSLFPDLPQSEPNGG